MKKVVITGGTGFIGIGLAHYLKEKGYHPVIVARNKPTSANGFEFHAWDGYSTGTWKNSLTGALAVVNLAGRTVDCIKSPDHCDEILRSRVESTRAVGKALREIENPPKIWIQMSTAHIYGDPPSIMCTEDSAFGFGLAPIVGRAWEKALHDSLPEDVREVRLRTSFVIGKRGGALPSLVRMAKMGLGGKAGHGKQGISWIHEYDMFHLILTAIENETYQGPYIASAPFPVSNSDFMKAIRSQLRIPLGLPAPAWVIRFGAKYVLKTDPDLVLQGRYVKSKRLEEAGFTFSFPELKGALKNLLN